MFRRTLAPPVLALVLALALLAGCAAQDGPPPETVDSVDLGRYAGLWYEIARMPNRFQRDCVGDVTATYVALPDESLVVVNRCRTAEGEDSARGVARPAADAAGGAKLEVSFVSFLGRQILWSDYWILQIGDDYQYAVVGTPDRSNGWILAREPTLSAQLRGQIDRRLAEQGYDPGMFRDTRQGGG